MIYSAFVKILGNGVLTSNEKKTSLHMFSPMTPNPACNCRFPDGHGQAPRKGRHSSLWFWCGTRIDIMQYSFHCDRKMLLLRLEALLYKNVYICNRFYGRHSAKLQQQSKQKKTKLCCGIKSSFRVSFIEFSEDAATKLLKIEQTIW